MTIALREAAKEIERLRAGGCARDQSTTQYCAEAAAKAAEITRLTGEVERLTKGRETMGNLWARERAARVAAEAEVGWLEAARAPEMADEITNLRAAQSNLIGTSRMLQQQVEDRDTTITRLTGEVERLKSDNELRDINGHNDALKAEYFEKGRATLTAEVERLNAYIANDADWKFSAKRRLELFREQRQKNAELTADNERLRAALEMFACDCAVHERCAEPDYCVNFQARRAELKEPRT
jgi:hypothetical protein